VLILLLAVANALRGAVRVERIAFVVLAAFGPVLWYVSWHHTEVLTWACVLTSLVALDEEKPARAALFAAIGALQAPPIVALAGFAVLCAAVDKRPARPRRVALAVLAASVAGLAPLFYLWKFGVPNIHVAAGYTDVRVASADRVFSLFFDLNQGMFPYAPATLLLGFVGLARCVARRDLLAAGVFATTLAMMLLASQTVHFNVGCANVNRYVIWIMPPVAWLAARGLPWERLSLRAVLALAVVGQLYVVARASVANNAHAHTELARYVLVRAPSLYSPEPRVFADRTREEFSDPWRPLQLPCVLLGPRGATKVLLDDESVATLRERYDVDAAWLEKALASRRSRQRPFYLEPPEGAVMPKLRKDDPVVLGEGWHGLESNPQETWSSMGKRGTLTARKPPFSPAFLVLRGNAYGELQGSAEVTFTVNGRVTAQHIAPRGRFARSLPIEGTAGDLVTVTIEMSRVARPPENDRDLGYSLFSAEITRAPPPSPTQLARFDGPGWIDPYGEGDGETHCLTSAADLTLHARPGGGRKALIVGGWAPTKEIGRPTHLRILRDGVLVDRPSILEVIRRRVAIDTGSPHVLRLEPEDGPELAPVSRVGFCLDILRFE
jgi:hypothetical protein